MTAELVAAIQRRDPELLEAAVRTVGVMGTPADEAVSHLIELLDPTDIRLCFRVIVALGRLSADAQDAVPKLKAMAEIEDKNLRRAAAAVLQSIEPGQHDELIEQATADQPQATNDAGDTLRITGFDPPLPAQLGSREQLWVQISLNLKSAEVAYVLILDPETRGRTRTVSQQRDARLQPRIIHISIQLLSYWTGTRRRHRIRPAAETHPSRTQLKAFRTCGS